MKKIFLSASLNIVTLLLFGWALVALYDTQMQFADIVKNSTESSWELSVNMTPLLLLFVICIPISIYFIAKGKRKNKSIWKVFMLPPEFEESDEREQLLTAKACRSSYIVMMFAAPIAASLLVFYPLIQDIIPYYPIIILLLLPVVQIISYSYSLYKNL